MHKHRSQIAGGETKANCSTKGLRKQIAAFLITARAVIDLSQKQCKITITSSSKVNAIIILNGPFLKCKCFHVVCGAQRCVV